MQSSQINQVTETTHYLTPSSDVTNWTMSAMSGMMSNVILLKKVVMTSYMSAFVIGMIGNVLVLYVVARFRQVRIKSVSNYYVWCLALADCLHVASLPIYCWATYAENWPIEMPIAADISCKFAFVMSDVSRFASVFLLVALSLDRYFAGYHDLGHMRTITVGQRVCSLVWVICIAFATP